MKNNTDQHRFEAEVAGKTAFIEYEASPGQIKLLHTEVPKELGGQGIAGTMTKQALEQIAAQNLKVTPLCPYVKAYLKKHPEYDFLVKK